MSWYWLIKRLSTFSFYKLSVLYPRLTINYRSTSSMYIASCKMNVLFTNPACSGSRSAWRPASCAVARRRCGWTQMRPMRLPTQTLVSCLLCIEEVSLCRFVWSGSHGQHLYWIVFVPQASRSENWWRMDWSSENLWRFIPVPAAARTHWPAARDVTWVMVGNQFTSNIPFSTFIFASL